MPDEGVHNHIGSVYAGKVIQARDVQVTFAAGQPEFDVDDYAHAVSQWALDLLVAGSAEAPLRLGDLHGDQLVRAAAGGPVGTFWEMLREHPNLVLRGDPGAGKSTMLRWIAHSLAQRQLNGQNPDCLPVLVHARVFRRGSPLAAAIRAAVLAELGPLLLDDLPSDLFAQPAPGDRPWLVLVDGLDELSGADRLHLAFSAITSAARRHGFLRFVVATRPVPTVDRAELPIFDLLGFGEDSLAEFAQRWFEARRIPEPAVAAALLIRHVREREIGSWAGKPQVAGLLCGEVVRSGGRNLPVAMVDLCDLLVRALGASRVVSVLERAAAERYFRDADLPLLDSIRGEVPGLDAAAVRKLLRGNEMFVATPGGIDFSHATVEEYFAARFVVRRLAAAAAEERFEAVVRIVDLLSPGYAFAVSQVPLFAVEMWGRRGLDPNDLILDFLYSAPEKFWSLARRLRSAGVVFGEALLAEFAESTLGIDLDEADRLGTAETLLDLDELNGIRRLLSIAADVDLQDAVRLDAIGQAVRRSPAAAAAMNFLVRARESSWEYPDNEAAALELAATGGEDDDRLAGLDLIAHCEVLPDEVRLRAACVAVQAEGHEAYLRLLKLRFGGKLTALLGEEAVHGLVEACTVLRSMAADSDLPAEVRLEAADELAYAYDDSAAEAFRALAEDPHLTESHRRRAAEALADLD
ncbi:NACHT domain-containing protein [Amycolatopsis sp. GA6-003]|uniref:NACHT domain-containing protein n=1 Tax=Amycolatopsis sp. GA6-003 TaxID=2652444 RepID=UPI00391708E5